MPELPLSKIKQWSELALVFLKLGTTAFGGPAAHIAMMEQEFVRRRRWLTPGEFLDLMGAVSLIPGPTSTEMAIFIGYRRAGWVGLLLGGVCFILPAMLMVTAIAGAYVRYGSLPQAARILYWIKPVIIAIVVQALWGLGKTAVKSVPLAVLGIAAAVLCFLGVNPLAVLFGSGAFMMMARRILTTRSQRGSGASPAAGMMPGAFLASGIGTASAAAAVPFGLWPLFFFFLKIGAVLFGSGYVLLAFLKADLVDRWHWLTAGQLLDAVAVGQITPGPVFTTATFIGYLLAGKKGALIATIGIFLPSFVLVAASGPLIARLRRWPLTGAFLDGVNVASLALMAAVTWQLGRGALVDPPTVLLALISAFLLLRYKLNSAWLVFGSIGIGLLFH
jgi:chromate transporter